MKGNILINDSGTDLSAEGYAALGVLLPRLDSGGQRLRVWSGKGKVSREGRLHCGVPES